jgi:hypothetical protein
MRVARGEVDVILRSCGDMRPSLCKFSQPNKSIEPTPVKRGSVSCGSLAGVAHAWRYINMKKRGLYAYSPWNSQR